jgi:hypothetical protein
VNRKHGVRIAHIVERFTSGGPWRSNTVEMPAQRPAALFEPISPELDLNALVEETPNFQYVNRIPCDTIESSGADAFEKLIMAHVVAGGKPLVIEGYNQRLNQWTFSTQWLRDNLGKKCTLLRRAPTENWVTC